MAHLIEIKHKLSAEQLIALDHKNCVNDNGEPDIDYLQVIISHDNSLRTAVFTYNERGEVPFNIINEHLTDDDDLQTWTVFAK